MKKKKIKSEKEDQVEDSEKGTNILPNMVA